MFIPSHHSIIHQTLCRYDAISLSTFTNHCPEVLVTIPILHIFFPSFNGTNSQPGEWGTAAEALLELYDPQLSVFSSNPFPGGLIPSTNPSTVFGLEYARQFINTNGQVFVGDSAVGDPASLGVSALLIGQSDGKYIDASKRQADYILNQAPRWSNGAISHRPDVAEIWADNMAMSFPFCKLCLFSRSSIHCVFIRQNLSSLESKEGKRPMTDVSSGIPRRSEWRYLSHGRHGQSMRPATCCAESLRLQLAAHNWPSIPRHRTLVHW